MRFSLHLRATQQNHTCGEGKKSLVYSNLTVYTIHTVNSAAYSNLTVYITVNSEMIFTYIYKQMKTCLSEFWNCLQLMGKITWQTVPGSQIYPAGPCTSA